MPAAGPPPIVPWLVAHPRRHWEPAFLVSLSALLALVLIPGLGRVPHVFGDEHWAEAMAGYTLAFEGQTRNPGLKGWGGAEQHFIQPRLFSAVVAAPVYRLFGYGLTQSRAVAAAFGALFVFGVYAASRQLFGPVAAGAAAVATAVDPWFFVTARQFRPEIFLAALLWWALFLLLRSIRRDSAPEAVLAGLLLGLAAWTHPNSAVFAAAALIALFAVIGVRGRWVRLVGFTGLGVAIGLLPFLAYVAYVQSISDVRFFGQIHQNRIGAWLRPIGEMLAAEWDRWSGLLRLPARAPLAVLSVLALLHAIIRGSRGDRLLAATVCLASVLAPLVIFVSTPRYLVILLPMLTLLIWRMLPLAGGTRWGEMNPGRRAGPWRLAAAGVALLLLGGMTAGATVVAASRHWSADFALIEARVRRAVPPGASVMANVVFWGALRDRAYVAPLPPDFNAFWPSVEAVGRHIRHYRPSYVVQTSRTFAASSGPIPETEDLDATKVGQAVTALARSVPSQIVLDLYDRHYGAVRVWRFDWSASTLPASATMSGANAGP